MERGQRVEEEITHATAEFLNRESNRNSLITVMRTLLSNDGRKANIMISVFPENREEQALWFLKRKRAELQNHLRQRTKIGRLPLLDFAIDEGEKNRQRIDELSNS